MFNFSPQYPAIEIFAVSGKTPSASDFIWIKKASLLPTKICMLGSFANISVL